MTKKYTEKDLAAIQKKIGKIKEKIEAHQQTISDLGHDAVMLSLEPFFEKYPNAVISWNQYMPHFNDGEECVFGSNHDHPYIGDGEAGDEEGDDDQQEMISKAFEMFDDDFMRQTYGEEVSVIISVWGLQLQECDHE